MPNRFTRIQGRLGLTTDWLYLGIASPALVHPFRMLIGPPSSHRAHWWRRWFALAALAAPLLLFAALGLLATNLFLLLQPDEHMREQAPLVPLVPGVNVAVARLPALLLALLLAGVLHEGGHALCALAWGERVDRFGLFIYGVYPGAYVELPGALERLPPLRALAIAAGGVWHNLITFLLLYLALTAAAQLSDDPHQMDSRGLLIVRVRNVRPPSALPFTQPSQDAFSGFEVGQRVLALQGQPVSSLFEWHAAFLKLHVGNFTSQGTCSSAPLQGPGFLLPLPSSV